MRRKIIYHALMICVLFAESCALMGVHINVHNPRHEGKELIFTEEQTLLGQLTKYRSCFDVNYYDLSLEVMPSEKSLEGIVEIYAKAVDDFDTLQIDLHQNFEISQIIDKESGNQLNYYRKERAVFIQLQKRKNEKFILKIAYKGMPVVAKKPPWKGGFVWKKDKEGNPWDGVACEADGASIWWPLKDHTSDEPDSVRLHYTVPDNLMAIGNGKLEGKTELNGKATYNWFVSYPINAYNVTIYVGKFKKIEDEYIGISGKKLEITHYVLAENYEKAKLHFKQLLAHLKLYEMRFGEYPWYNDGFKLVESPYAGMEHQSAIAYGNRYKNDADTETDYIILHETAHEWWGNSVTAKDFAHVWLQEGFATYSEALFFEEKYGFQTYKNHLYLYRLFIKNKYPLVMAEGKRWFHYRKSSDVYTKGAWILHTLRMQINNDAVFFDILKTFSQRYKYKLAESKDFIDIVNEKTQSDYNWFFNQYLYKSESPALLYCYSANGAFFYKWSNTNDDFDKLNLRLKSQNKAIIITPTNEVQKLYLPKDYLGGWEFTFFDDMLFVFRKKETSLIKEYYDKHNNGSGIKP